MYKYKKLRKAGLQIFILVLSASVLFMNGCARRTPEKLLKDAQEAMKQYDFISAQIKLEDFIKYYPNDPRAVQAQFGIAQIHRIQKNPMRAIDEYNKIVKKYPPNSDQSVSAKFEIAFTYASQTTAEGYAKAKELLQKISDDTTNAYAGVISKLNISQIYENEKNWAKVEESYKAALAQLPTVPKIPKQELENQTLKIMQDEAMMEMRAGKPQKAIDIFQSMQNKYPENEYAQGVSIWNYVQIGDVYMTMNQGKKAKENYDKAIVTYAKVTGDKLIPDKSAWATLKIGEIYEHHLGDTTMAKQIYTGISTTKTRWSQYAQGYLARMNQPPKSMDTTKPMNSLPLIDPNKKK